MTPEEYLKIERAAEFRSEYFNGRMYAMAGGSYRQAVIINNVSFALRSEFGNRQCQVTTNDVRFFLGVGWTRGSLPYGERRPHAGYGRGL